jgi:tRNA-dihydrouridine synthase B
MRIGNRNIRSGVLLAPMEDVTDQAFRLLCRRHGADVVYTEFASAEGIVRDVAAVTEKLAFSDEERPIGIQIYGNRPDAMASAAANAASLRPDILDINFGCPTKRVAGGNVTQCSGSGLLRFPNLMEEIACAVVETARPLGIPVTAKTRLGWDGANITILDTVERMARCGVQALTIHGRTRAQMFKGDADWEWIRRAKEAAPIPIIGNGDVTTPEDVVRMFDATGVDAVMIGRGAIGNPWLFARAKAALSTGTVPPEPTLDERLALYLQHVALVYQLKGRRGVVQVRKHMKRYVSEFPHATELRTRLMTLDDPSAIQDAIVSWFGDAAAA